MSEWINAGESWPSHPNSEWRKTLGLARSAGWSFMKYRGHSYGAVTCDPDADHDRCFETIFSTAVGSEGRARTLRRKIERCRHRRGPLPTIEAVTIRLERIRSVVDAAGRCLDADEHRGRARDLLGEAAAGVDEEERLLDEAQDQEDQALDLMRQVRDLTSAEGLLVVVEMSAPLHAVEGLLAEAGAGLDAVDKEVEQLIQGTRLQGARRRELRDQCQALRAAIEYYRGELL